MNTARRHVLCAQVVVLFGLALAGCSSSPNSGGQAAVVVNTPAAPVQTIPAAPAAKQPASNLAHYRDPVEGVSFDYPNIWARSTTAPGYFGGEVPNDYGGPRLAVTFSPAGNVYAATVLSSLVFTYSTKPARSAADCARGLQDNMMPPKSVTINGTPFTEYAGGDAGMCHQQAAIVDATYDAARNSCLAFERDFNTECYGAGDNKRKLTSDETQALHRHLDAIMQSVNVEPK